MPGADTLRLVGRTIAQKYAVEAVVGEGGFATVYRATHLLWKRPVALKVFRAFGELAPTDRQKLLDEFIQEGAVLTDLSARSAAIVQARDIAMLVTDGGEEVPYLVLEWLEGKTLEEVLADEKGRALAARSVSDAVQLLEPAAEALALAHSKGIAHRDVKPANIFVLGDPCGEATVKLLDFGIAKVVSDAQKMAGTFTKTSGNVTSFTPAYGAPEQFSRTYGATGPWTDVFALALVLVETLTGREPLDGDDFVQLAISSADPTRRPTPKALGALVSAGVGAVFAKALAVRPGERFQSAGEFWNALRLTLKMDPLAMTEPRAAARWIGAATVDVGGVISPASGAAPSPTGGPASRGATATAMATEAAASARPSVSVTAPWGQGRAPWALAATGAVVAAGALVALVASRAGGASAGGGHAGGSVSSAAALAASEAVNGGGAVLAPGPASGGLPAGVASPPPSAGSHGRTDACPRGMIAIPGGSFFMGSDDGLALEKPAHQVMLSPYCIDRFEVTVERYKSCSDDGRCKRAGATNQWSAITDKERKALDPLCNARDPETRASHPVNCVEWEMADKFCHEQGEGARLPTEAEWEFAARGPDGRKYPWGDEDPAAGYLNACGRECVAWGATSGIEQRAMYDADDGFATTAPVGSFPKGASRYGVEDVVGNVWEWVSDWYGPYVKEEQRDPVGAETGGERVIRGGSWNASYPAWVRPTFRYKDAPTKRSYGIGFRCARSLANGARGALPNAP